MYVVPSVKPEPGTGNRGPGSGGAPTNAAAPRPPGIEFLYGPDDVPPAPRLLTYGFQWVLVAIGPITLFVPVISTYLHLTPDQTVAYVQRMLLLTGIMTLIQNLWGHRYPLQEGPAGAMLLALVAVAPEGAAAVNGGLIVGGIAGGLVAATGGETATLHTAGSEQMLELNWYPSSNYASGSELDHLAFEVEDIEATASRLVELGGRVAREVERTPEYDLGYVTDPDGIWIELVHPKRRH